MAGGRAGRACQTGVQWLFSRHTRVDSVPLAALSISLSLQVVIKNMRFLNGNSKGNVGGLIYAQGAVDLTFINCEFGYSLGGWTDSSGTESSAKWEWFGVSGSQPGAKDDLPATLRRSPAAGARRRLPTSPALELGRRQASRAAARCGP